ncbi:MAG: hypothetical protein M3680_03465 [Myxococcota bacterium]|nr:hypothetical protein [Myxococcota bacterium]
MPAADAADSEMATQLERIIRRVKASMNYRGSYSTRDILGSLVIRWVHSGEWDRLKELPAEHRRLGESVRRFILDRLAQLRRRGRREELDDNLIGIPDDSTLLALIDLAQLRRWIVTCVGDLEAGRIDARVRIPIAQPRQLGQVLRLHLDGKTQREIAGALGLSLGVVNKRLAEATNYLVVLQTLAEGLGAP